MSAPPAPGLPGMPVEGTDDSDEADFEIPEPVSYAEMPKGETPRGSATDPSGGMIEGRIVSKRHDGVFVDIGQKSEAFLPFQPNNTPTEPLEVGHVIEVIVTGQSRDGYPLLSNLRMQRPQGWHEIEAAYRTNTPVLGRVVDSVRAGLIVDVGVRAFMPASRSGEYNDEDMRKLVGEQIRARILKFDEADNNVLLDRRAVLDEERRDRLESLKVGDRVKGKVRSIKAFGIFVDLGGIDALLHVSDISWQRVHDISSTFQRGQELEVQVLKVDRKSKRIGVGLKQLQPEPWSLVGEKIKVNDRIRGKVVKLTEYGAFVEVIPGVEGLVHISDMSYARRIDHPKEIVSVGDMVEVMVLALKLRDHRISLGLKQAMGNPWDKVANLHPVGSAVTGKIRRIAHFGAFVEILEGVEALLHISDITSERRLNSPAEVLKEGQRIRVKVLELDPKKRRLKVGMKQLEPTEIETFVSQVEVGEIVTGRVVKTDGRRAVVELGTGISGVCPVKRGRASRKAGKLGQTSDLVSLKSMLESAWKGKPGESAASDGAPAASQASAAPLTAGSIHSFRITKLDAAKGLIELAQI